MLMISCYSMLNNIIMLITFFVIRIESVSEWVGILVILGILFILLQYFIVPLLVH
jgi:hypothetical protein